MNIPESLLEQFERGNVLLFIGERLTLDAQGRPFAAQLAARLAARCEGLSAERLTFPQIAQAYQYRHGRQALVQLVRDQYAALGNAPQHSHQLLTGLTACTVLATTSLDPRLERAFATAGRPLHVTTGNVDVAFAEAHETTLYTLRGTLAQPESLVLTEDDHEAFFRNRASLSVVLQAHLATKTILFLGYELDDPYFKRFYCEITEPLDQFARRAYAFGPLPPVYLREWCAQHHIEVIEAETTSYLEAFGRQLAARVPLAPPPAMLVATATAAAEAPLPERPYKLLDYYEAQDAAIFYGREAETQELVSLIHAHRLVLLYGASGTGKTSLLLAGAVPRLENAAPAYATLYVRALEDPAWAIRRAVTRKLPNDTSLPGDVLVNFLHAATRALGQPLVLILDQFEEFFIRLSPEFRQAFIKELGALCDARDVPVKVVLSLREDWLAAISEIETRIPEVFQTRLRLLPLTQEQAREAIVAPVTRLGVHYEPALVTQLLHDLARAGSVFPPQLQLVCSALYGSLGKQGTTISLAAYEALGGARGVLQAYLEAELIRLPANEQHLARDVLEELVTSERTKAVKPAGELALVLSIDAALLKPVLEKLVRARLLRMVDLPATNEPGYELAHEYLIAEIALSPEAVARKEAEELLRQGVENYTRFGTLLATEALALIDAQRARLRLDDAGQALLLRSALRHGQEVGYWLGRMEDGAQAVTLTAEVLCTPSGAIAAQNLAETADAASRERLMALIDRLLASWRAGPATARSCAREALWQLRAYAPRGRRLQLWLSRAPQTARRLVLPLVGVLLGALLIALLVWGPRWLTSKPDMAWVDVPAGTFMMGSDPDLDLGAGSDELPQHEVTLDAFRIGQYEVTNAQYARCVQATVCDEPEGLQNYQDPEYAEHPVVYVSWFDAERFCRWIGGRLPTEAQWEYAARGTDGRLYPWGNAAPTCEVANYRACAYNGTLPVGSLPAGASPFGALDMAGNVWEWTADWYDADYYEISPTVNPGGPGSGSVRVVRGGGWHNSDYTLRAASRIIGEPDGANSDVGFRCVDGAPGN